MNTKDKGNVTEAVVLAHLVRAGHKILLPFGDNLRYDLLIDNDDGTFTKVQCKTGRLKSNGSVVRFQSCSSQYHRSGKKQGYRGEIDFFGVYCPQNNKTYLVPVDDVGEYAAVLKIKAGRKNYSTTKWAKDYEL